MPQRVKSSGRAHLRVLSALMATLVAGSVLVPGRDQQAEAAGTPDIVLSKSMDSETLYGDGTSVTLTASNPLGPDGFNLSFNDVLPVGTSYASPSVAPTQVLANAPGPGQTTLIWENVADLQTGSSFTISYTMTHSTGVHDVGATLANSAGAYVNTDVRTVPDFDPVTGIATGDFTGSDTTIASTDLIPFRLTKSEPNTEAELLRGLHDHQTLYELTIENNLVASTTDFSVEDWLPAELEFLGCGLSDNTTFGTLEEYPGSGPINPGNAPPIPSGTRLGCIAPTTVDTVTIDPDGTGPLPTGVYTHVVWNAATIAAAAPGWTSADLAATETMTLHYVAAVPMFANTTDWSRAPLGEPSSASGLQASNIDNNVGPSTEETLAEIGALNSATATGTYSGDLVSYSDDDTEIVNVEDLSIHKSVDTGTIIQGGDSQWTLLVESSEYVTTVSNIVVTDTLPDGLCPRAAGSPDAECAGGPAPSHAYTSATENADGSWTLVWDFDSIGALGSMGRSESETLTFWSKTRQNYQEGFVDDTPVLANDAWTNTVALAGSADGRLVEDVSSAGQQAGGVSILKEVADASAAPVTCGDGSAHSWNAALAGPFGPGDRVCWRLTVTYAPGLDASNTDIQDYLPAGFTYESWMAGFNNTVPPVDISFDGSGAGSGLLQWTVGDGGGYVDESEVLELVVSSIITDPTAASDADLVANLMKMSYQNTSGQVFPLRDEANADWVEPEISLSKGVQQITGGVSTAQGPNGPNVDNQPVQGGDVVTYRVDVTNSGTRDAESMTVWDILPAQITCGDVTVISHSGTCNGAFDRIEWTGHTVTAAGSIPLTYSVAIPADIGPSESLDNTAGVTTFSTQVNTGPVDTFTFYPANNLNPAFAPLANTTAADDPSNVYSNALTITKVRATEVNDAAKGNTNDQAAIGEEVAFTVQVALREGTTVYNAVLTDPIPGWVAYLSDAAAILDGGPLPAGWTLDDTGGAITITLATPYTIPVDGGDKVLELTWTGQVLDDATVVRRDNKSNTATFDWENQSAALQTASATVNTRIVEPHLTVAKDENDLDDIVVANQEYRYTVTVTNDDDPGPQSNDYVSAAYDLTVIDLIPTQVTPLNAPGVPATDGQTIWPDGGLWDETARTITWTVAELEPGATVVLDYDVVVNDPVVGSITIDNSVTVAGSSLPDPLDNEGERDAASPNGGPGSGYQANVTDRVAAPNISLTKVANPGTATIGDDLRYTLTATVPAGVVLYDATLIDDLPTGVAYDGTFSASCDMGGGACVPAIGITNLGTDGDVAAWFLGDLSVAGAADRVITIVYDAHVEDLGSVNDGDTLTNSLNIYGHQSDVIAGTPPSIPLPGGFDVSGSIVSAGVDVVEPLLTIDKDVNGQVGDTDARRAIPGETLTYTLVIGNTGSAPAYDATVTDTPDARFVVVDLSSGPGYTVTDADPSDGTLSWSVAGPIAPAGTVTITYQVQVPVGFDSGDEIPAGPELTNVADVPSYYGVPLAERFLNGFAYRDYDNVMSDQVDIELDLATMGDQIWFDRDGDGVMDAGEPGIAGVDVTATYLGPDGVAGGGDDEVFATTTAADGSWVVPHLPGGNFVIDVDTADLPAGLTNPTYDLDDGTTSPDAATAAGLGENEDKTDVDFGFNGTGSIGDIVWFDRDADGVVDAAEPGLSGVDVTVTWFGPDGVAGGGDDVAVNTTTDASGGYSVTGLPAGNYQVTIDAADLPPGFSAASDLDGTPDDQTTMSLAAGANRTDADFGYNGTGSVGDFIWLDLDGGGDLDAGEPAIEGVIVELTWDGQDATPGTGDDVTFQTTTNGAGSYVFENLPPGGYVVDVTGALPSDVANSYDEDLDLDSSVGFLLATGENHLTADFAYAGSTMIGDRVWYDVNADGVQDLGEPGIPGVEVTLTYFGADNTPGGGDDIVFVTTTDAGGDYLFTGLPGGDFHVAVTDSVPAGMTITYDENDGTTSPDGATVVLGLGAAAHLTADFGYAGAGSLGDTVWLDLDGDGAQGGVEPGLPGVDVVITWFGADGVAGGPDDVTMRTTTDSDGNYTLGGLPAGTFDVSIDPATLPAGLDPTFDLDATPDGSTLLTLAAGEVRADVDFGYNGGASIGDTVWFDRNGDGIQDADESALAAVDLTLTWAGPNAIFGDFDDEIFTTSTDSAGNYLFANLGAGSYTVAVETLTLPPAMVAIYDEDGGGDSIVAVTLADDEVHLTADFAYNGTGSIGDTIWLDLNGDGLHDPGEPGVGGQPVELTWPGEDGILGNADDEVYSTTTDASGVYTFPGLPPGDYEVSVVGGIAAAAGNTHDEDGDLDGRVTVALAAGLAHTSADFGYRGLNALGDTVWFDVDANGSLGVDEDGIAGVEVTVVWLGPDGLEGTSDDITLPVGLTDADGEYAFAALPDGNFSVTVTGGLPAGLANTHDADGDLDGHTVLIGLAAGATDLTADFGYSGTAVLGDTVWLDVDTDGVHDADEPVIAGVGVTATWAGPDAVIDTADDVAFTTVTDADGLYRFEALPDGLYAVVIDPADLAGGSEPFIDLDGGDPALTTITLAPGEQQLDADFAAAGDARLDGSVWFDGDGDGLQGPDEVGISGIVVRVTWSGPDGDVTLTVTTGADGGWELPRVPPGGYDIVIDLATVDPAFVPTTATESNVTLLPGGSGRFDGGFALPVTIGDLIWIDEDGDGRPDADEPVIEGVEVTLELVDGTVVGTSITDDNGQYRFHGVAPGTYIVRINPDTIPAELTLTVDPDGTSDFTTTVTVESGEVVMSLDFGFQDTSELPVTGFDTDLWARRSLWLVLSGVFLLWAARGRAGAALVS